MKLLYPSYIPHSVSSRHVVYQHRYKPSPDAHLSNLFISQSTEYSARSIHKKLWLVEVEKEVLEVAAHGMSQG
ncbi:hypothetical protein A0H81_06578 [Grifola frondosa]|uniref:Uncharacterized protein n=1 Tax=Grifola frondosa TaxID=5627 RepID=A0A1C7MFB4_GRIFR|nr:hypothetical protein A0H81_06578 [Grifola frondosa]